MKTLLWLVVFVAVGVQAQPNRPVSGEHARRLNNLLTEWVGADGYRGFTDDGIPCAVSFKEHNRLFNGVPSVDTFRELLIQSSSAKCGGSGARFMIDEGDYLGRGSLYNIGLTPSTLTAFMSMNVNAAELSGQALKGTLLNVWYQRGQALVVELNSGKSCICKR